MSVEKEPITESEFEEILSKAGKYTKKKKEELTKLLLLLRYTGMHISVIIDSKYKLHEKKIDGNKYIVWYRPKKDEGKESKIIIRKSKYLKFDIGKYAEGVRNRKRKKSRQYFYNLIKDVGNRAKIDELSPMSLRHTFAVGMLDKGVPDKLVQQWMGCTDKTLKTYAKYSTKRAGDVFDKIDW